MLLVEVSFLLLLCLSEVADQQGTTVKPGDDATLQCHCPSDAAVTMLEWTRPEQNPDDYVFFYRNNRLIKEFQHPSFRGRVELRDPEMKDGDVSVTLKNVTVKDAGTYKCTIISITTENGERTTTEFSSHVRLTVTDSGALVPLAEGNKDEGDYGGEIMYEGDKDEGDKDEGDYGGGIMYEGDKDEGDYGGGNEDGGNMYEGHKDEGDYGGGNKNWRKFQELDVIAACPTVAVLLLIIIVIFIRYKRRHKQTT